MLNQLITMTLAAALIGLVAYSLNSNVRVATTDSPNDWRIYVLMDNLKY